MARPASSNKRDNEKKRVSKRLEKQKKKDTRKSEGKRGFDEMIAYVDENGMITSTPPDMDKKKEEISIDDIVISTPKKEESDEATITLGRVEYFNSSKGYGFIKSLQSGEKYFFHISDVAEEINENDIVSYDLGRGPRGMVAINIKPDKPEPAPQPQPVQKKEDNQGDGQEATTATESSQQ